MRRALAAWLLVAASAAAVASQDCGTVNATYGYWYVSRGASPGNNIVRVNAGTANNWTALTAECDSVPFCVGVDTEGWLKHTINGTSLWNDVYADSCKGLLVKADPTPAPLSTLAKASALKVGQLCATARSFANGQRLVLAACSSSTSGQTFSAGTGDNANRIEVLASGSPSGFCLEVEGAGTNAGTPVIVSTCSTGNNQQWSQDTPGRLHPRNAPLMCLDTAGSSTAPGTALVINACSDASSQRQAPTPRLLSTLADASALKIGGLCITARSFANGQRLELAACSSGMLGQTFCAGTGSNASRIEVLGLSNNPTGLCLDVERAGTNAGTPVIVWPCGTGWNAQWALDTPGRLHPRHASLMCLDTAGSSTALGAAIVINICSDARSQRPEPTPALLSAEPTPAPLSALANAAMLQFGQLCLSVPFNNYRPNPAMAPCGWPGQTFRVGTGANAHRIEALTPPGSTTGLCLDVEGAATNAGTRLIVWVCSAEKNQQWALDAAGRLRPRHAPGMCLDAANSSTATWSPLVINACSDAPSQRLVITPIG